MSTAAVVPEAQPSAKLSAMSRMVNTFIAPSQTFSDLKHHTTWTSWIAPWLLIAVLSVAYVAVVGQKVGFEQVMRNQLRLSPARAEQLEKLPPEQRARQMDISVKITRVFSFTAPIFNLIFALIIAGVLMATFNFGVGAEVPFKTSLAIVMYSFLAGTLKAVLAIVSLLAGSDPEGFLIQNPVATNPGYFMDAVGSPFLYALASALDVTTIWSLVLCAIGFSCVSKMNKGTTMSVVFGWYVVFTLAGAAIGAAFS
jgi:hypothetical protein